MVSACTTNPPYGFTGFIDADTTRGIRRFQEANDLKVDGWLAPNGETEQAMKSVVDERPALRQSPLARDEMKAVDLLSFRPSEDARGFVLPLGVKDSATHLGFLRKPLWPEGGGEPVTAAMAPAAVAGAVVDKIWRYGVPLAIGAVDAIRRSLDAPSAPPRSGEGEPEAGERNGPGRFTNPGREIAKRIAQTDIKTEPLENSRGGDQTQADIDRSTRKCLKIAERDYPDVYPHLRHEGGGTQNGEGKEHAKEFYIPNRERDAKGIDARKDSSRADRTIRDKRKGEKEAGAFWHHNSQSTLADGVTPTPWEIKSFKRLMDNAMDQVITSVPKRSDGMSDEEYDKILDKHCRDGLKNGLAIPVLRRRLNDFGG